MSGMKIIRRLSFCPKYDRFSRYCFLRNQGKSGDFWEGSVLTSDIFITPTKEIDFYLDIPMKDVQGFRAFAPTEYQENGVPESEMRFLSITGKMNTITT
jgi:hypothetical protein